MKKLIISISCLLSLTGCYEFAKPPFDKSEMTPVKNSELAEQIINEMKFFPIEDVEHLKDIKEIYKVSPTLEIAQHISEDGATRLTIFMKNEHHLMACDLVPPDELDWNNYYPAWMSEHNEEFYNGHDAVIDGDVEELRRWALDYIMKGPKVCYAVPMFDKKSILITDSNFEDDPIIFDLKSDKSVNGISMKGKIKIEMFGNQMNMATGRADFTFYRSEDDKSFSIKDHAFFGFYPPNGCMQLFDDDIGSCIVPNPAIINLSKKYVTGADGLIGHHEPIIIDDQYLKIVNLFGEGRGNNSYDVYKLINDKDNFYVKFLYKVPTWGVTYNEDNTFSHYVSGYPANEFVWIKVGPWNGDDNFGVIHERSCLYNYEKKHSIYREFIYNKSTNSLEKTEERNNC
tara:strand:+ start:463 stop:1662 length:1200 start_codon:yes stop_codon:yes gene_type:complete